MPITLPVRSLAPLMHELARPNANGRIRKRTHERERQPTTKKRSSGRGRTDGRTDGRPKHESANRRFEGSKVAAAVDLGKKSPAATFLALSRSHEGAGCVRAYAEFVLRPLAVSKHSCSLALEIVSKSHSNMPTSAYYNLRFGNSISQQAGALISVPWLLDPLPSPMRTSLDIQLALPTYLLDAAIALSHACGARSLACSFVSWLGRPIAASTHDLVPSGSPHSHITAIPRWVPS